jgi:hypothetical protein
MRFVALLLLLCAGTAEAQGRPLRVSAVSPLGFGTLIAGVAARVSPTDAGRAGQYELRGAKSVSLQLEFLLPAGMAGPGGATIPLAFGPGDGGWSPSGSAATQSAFDPRVPGTFLLPTNGKATVFLGGRALPSNGQPAGEYAGTVTLVVSYLGS